MVTGRLPVRCVAALALLAALLGGAVASSGCAAPRTTMSPRAAKRDQPFTVSRVEVPFRAVSQPQEVGAFIYFVAGEDADKGSALVRYDPRVRRARTVLETRAPKFISWFVANEKWLVWSAGRDLYARSLTTGQQHRVAGSRDLYAPALSGDLVAFDDLSETRAHQMVVHDLATRESTVVASVELADLYNNFPSWDGHRVLWTDVVDGTGVYRSYDASTGDIENHRISSNEFRYPGYAKPAGDRFYSINFDDVENWNWGDQRVGFYSTRRERFVPLEPAGFVANSLEVAGGLVAVVDSGQRLSIRLVDSPEGRAFYPIAGRIDFVQASSDGTLIAWREGEEVAENCELYLIRRR